MARQWALVSTTGFRIFPFSKTDEGNFKQLAPALPAVYDGVRNQTLHLIATFEVEPGHYDLWVGVGPNSLEVQQHAPTGWTTIESGEQLRARASIHISLPNEERSV